MSNGEIIEIVLASGNEHKADEIENWLQGRGHPVRVVSAREFGGMDGCEETGTTFEENAQLKVEFLLKRIPPNFWVLADDSGLAVDALQGEPGVFSARFAGEGASDRQNRELLLERIRKVSSPRRRSARFVCVLALSKNHKPSDILLFRGECEGRILCCPHGDGGFGYDSVFAATGSQQSFAEISQEEKSLVSHRGRALEKLEKELTG
tara:strand:+ start:19137 stop:19760 length:624 start_codon:yes stop_codon:yes gene_type:complete